MKTSSKLLLGLLLGLVVATFGATISLRRQYDALDKSDKYGRWKKVPLAAFRAIKISGPFERSVEIERAATTRLLVDTLSVGTDTKAGYVANVVNDTLLLTLKPEPQRRPSTDYEGAYRPAIRVQCPALTSLTTIDASAQLSDFAGATLTLTQLGKTGDLSLKKVQFQQLTALLAGKNHLTIAKDGNRIEQAAITLRDSSSLHQYNEFSKGFTLDAAPGTSLQLTGKAMAQVRK
ncbi:hypothetical protein FAES_3589 [Fibrella aestuarina BUZ 2]|uniref:Uncharacterized protein n=1 Tax=Fibrella aestuarina BUZ 2 TaxID=1166018 RepID=I0KBU3_9BACT|nr:hypothetical protein [Fibrella aestuarina]CCH01596.1 hypothetical protein FAES_3589 [Fibrella aestuarina BUZ 2]